MAAKSQKKPEKAKRDTFKVEGTEVFITRSGDHETLQINGRLEEFHQTEDGYRLKRDVYQKPAKSLRAAVERYLQSEAVK